MPNTFDTFQTPNRKSLGTNQQDKIQWLFWNEMGWGEGGGGGGGGGGQGVFLQQVTSQKLLVESKGIFQTWSDLSFLSIDKIELRIGI